MSRQSPLANQATISLADLRGLTEIAHADHYVPNLSADEVMRHELQPIEGRRVFVYERASQFELLGEDARTYMWVSPIPEKILERYDLVQRRCVDNDRVYKDVLIHRRNHELSSLEQAFIGELYTNRDRYFK